MHGDVTNLTSSIISMILPIGVGFTLAATAIASAALTTAAAAIAAAVAAAVAALFIFPQVRVERRSNRFEGPHGHRDGCQETDARRGSCG